MCPAFQDANGVWRCGTAASPGDPDCVPFNIFGGMGPDGKGTITREMLDYVTFTQHDASEQRLTDAVANITGQLVSLPGGWLGVAAGVEHRRLSGFFEPDAVVTAGDTADVPAQPLAGSYNVSEAYAEVRVPVIAKKPGAQLIDVSAAGRLSRYSFLTTEANGKLGARWKPTSDLVVRGSYGQGFRAPSIGELFGSESRFDAALEDPCSDFNRPEIPQAVRDRCIALGVPADGSYMQLNPQISVTTGGNRDLDPERARSINVSAAYSRKWAQDKSWASSLDLEVAYFDVTLDGAISALDAQLQLDRCVSGGDDTLCQGISRTAQGSINGFTNKLLNIGGIDVRGVDLTIAYKLPRKKFGRFRFLSQTSYLAAYKERVPSADGFESVAREGTVAGTPERAFPKLKSQLAIGWQYGRVDLTATTRYIDGVTEPCRDLADFPDTCSDFNTDDDTLSTNKLPATVYNDIQVLWVPAFAPDLTITAGVNNLLNRDPPVCYSCSLNGFNGTTYDVPGVFGYVSAQYHLQ
jgi:iron complex outermembrane receptor protein